MTPKEKAYELVDRFMKIKKLKLSDYSIIYYPTAKQCALIAVDECIESTKQLINHYTKGYDERYVSIYLSMSLSVQYWQEVKQEIERL